MSGPPDFLDEARISVAGGKGGDGAVHFRREKFVPLGGPDGGDGGSGGDVILQADTGLNTLQSFRHRRQFQAEAGAAGSRSRRNGKGGADLVVAVPVGTTVNDAGTGQQLFDLATPGARALVARGGQGGLGNAHFATSTSQAPRFAERGQPGQERRLVLELKLVADAGIIGLPNAGKSTVLAAMSAARPKVAGYPFTTLVPNLGVVAVDDTTFVAADIPGLIEGAHQGHGLGDQFLRHIERTRVLLHVVDAAAEDPHGGFEAVMAELGSYDQSLLERPQLVALNKMDLPEAEQAGPELTRRLEARGYRVYPISGLAGSGIDALVRALAATIAQARAAVEPAEEGEFVFRARVDPNDFTVERKRGTFTVRGQTVERVVSMTDMESVEARDRLQRQLKRLGVLAALEREGVREGNRVVIGEEELLWQSELEEGAVRPGGRTAPENRRRTARGTRASKGRRRG